jgi:DNA-binding NarL/FixJ family response regulator
MKILIIEDDFYIGLYLKMLVTEFGYEVCAIAGTCATALQLAARHRPDIAITDVRLARGDSGLDAARELHTVFGMRCIFLSGNLDERTKKAATPYEPLAFLHKPVSPLLLQQALGKARQAAKSAEAFP